MAARKTTTKAKAKPATKVESVEAEPKEVKVGAEAVLIFQAKRPMTIRAFNAAAEMLRAEQEATGVKIVLMPHSVEVKE